MSDTSAIDAASRRLGLAMDALEAAVERRREADRGQSDLSEQIHALGTDRSQLAANLDTAAARVRMLETTNREIARRLDVAIESVRNVLEANDR
jgi:septal ring factor EnvC (AmiA/AmiB activator)